MPLTPDRASYIAKLIADTWNSLAKENGWPKRIASENVMRMRPVITGVDKGLSRIGESTRKDETMLRWILCRWNWKRSPAPLPQVSSPKLWDYLKDSLDREAEETVDDIQRQLNEVVEWARFSFKNAVAGGLSPEKAAERVENFAQSSGKINSWNNRERIRFQEEIEELRQTQVNPT